MLRMLGRRVALLVTSGALVVSGGLAATAAPETGRTAAAQDGPELAPVGAVALPETTAGVLDLAVSRDGTRAVAVGEHWLQVMSLTSDNPRLLGLSTAVFGEHVELSKDGRTAYVLSSGDTLYVVDVAGSKKPRKVRQLYRGRLSPSHVFDMEISRNGRFLYLKHGFVISDVRTRKGIQVFSLANPRKPRKVAHTNAPEWGGEIAASRNGRHLVTTSQTTDNYALLYRVPKKRTGKPKRVKRLRLPFPGEAVTISEDNRFAYVLSASTEYPMAVGKINLKKRKLVKTRRLTDWEDGLGLDISPDGKYLYASMWRSSPSSMSSFITIDARTFEPLHQAADPALYAPHVVRVSRGGPTKGRIYVPSYTGIMGGNPVVFVLSYT